MKNSVLIAALVLGVVAASPARAQGAGMGGGGYGGFGDRPDYGGPMRSRREYVPASPESRVSREVRSDRRVRTVKSRAKRSRLR